MYPFSLSNSDGTVLRVLSRSCRFGATVYTILSHLAFPRILDQKREAFNWLTRAQVLARQAGNARTLQEARALLVQLHERELGQNR